MTQQNYSILLSSGELSPSSLLSLLPTLDTQDLHSAIGALLTESHNNPTIVKALANHLEQIYIKISTTSSITSPISQTNGDEHVHVQDSSQTPPPGTRVTTPVERSSDPIRRVEIALDALRRGEFIVVPDSAERENEADLIIAAEHATAEKLAFMINETSGLICVGVQGERLDELKLPQMVINNTESHGTAFTVSIDYKIGTTTGISAGDRAKTIKALTDRSVEPEHFSRPGHIFPLRAREGGVLVRPGHTEATVDFCRLAGCFPAGALCEIVNKDGSMTRPTHVKQFSERHNLASVSIADLIEYRRQKENKQ